MYSLIVNDCMHVIFDTEASHFPVYNTKMLVMRLWFIGANLSEPHTNQYYEKIAILMYVLCSDISAMCS